MIASSVTIYVYIFVFWGIGEESNKSSPAAAAGVDDNDDEETPSKPPLLGEAGSLSSMRELFRSLSTPMVGLDEG